MHSSKATQQLLRAGQQEAMTRFSPKNDVGRTELYSPRGRSHDASSVGAVAVAELVVESPRIVVVEAQAVADLVRQGHHVADGVLAGELQPGRKNLRSTLS